MKISAEPNINSKHKDLRVAATDYLKARAKFRALTDKMPELSGNDNLVGRIGEFVALQFLGRRVPSRNASPTVKGYDIVCKDGARVSVKTITHESNLKRSTRINEPWDELVVVEIGEQSKILRIGHLTKVKFQQALRENPRFSKTPYCKLSMLGNKGLIKRYGSVYDTMQLKTRFPEALL